LDAHGIGARERVGGSGDFAHAPRPALGGLVPQFHRDALADGERAKLVLGQRDSGFARAISGQGVHRLPGGKHLPGFGQTVDDHAIGGRAQDRVVGLIARHGELRVCGIALALRGLPRGQLGIEQ